MSKNVVLYSMSSRKCVYTGRDANCNDKVIPKNGGDEVHNWANSVPCSDKYKAKKARNHPTELEMSINRAFKMLELAKLDVRYWEIELDRLRSQLEQEPPKKEQPSKLSKTTQKKKDREVKVAYKEVEIKQIDFEKTLKEKKMVW